MTELPDEIWVDLHDWHHDIPDYADEAEFDLFIKKSISNDRIEALETALREFVEMLDEFPLNEDSLLHVNLYQSYKEFKKLLENEDE